jgi:hypothetical protein
MYNKGTPLEFVLVFKVTGEVGCPNVIPGNSGCNTYPATGGLVGNGDVWNCANTFDTNVVMVKSKYSNFFMCVFYCVFISSVAREFIRKKNTVNLFYKKLTFFCFLCINIKLSCRKTKKPNKV